MSSLRVHPIYKPRDGQERVFASVRRDGQVRSKAFALTWYRALTRYCSPARPFAALDVPLLVTGQQGSPPPRANSFPGLEMRARGAQAKNVPS